MNDKNINKFLIVLVAFLIIIVLGLSGYLVFNKINFPKKENKNNDINELENLILYDGKKGEKNYFYKNEMMIIQ